MCETAVPKQDAVCARFRTYESNRAYAAIRTRDCAAFRPSVIGPALDRTVVDSLPVIFQIVLECLANYLILQDVPCPFKHRGPVLSVHRIVVGNFGAGWQFDPT